MNSSLYHCLVMHHRFSPKVHKFHYRTFMWCFDLDELDELHQKSWFFSRNRFNLFSFWDKDHLLKSGEKEVSKIKTETEVKAYLKINNIDLGEGKIYLITNLRTLGYLFNPVSFYYCFNEQNEPVAAIAEVGNTYYEMKTFMLGHFENDAFELRTKKHFYVSPFTKLDDEFDFKLKLPSNKLNIKIDDYREGEKFFISTLTGEQKALNNWSIIGAFIRFPFHTLQVIVLIHWQAFKLWVKKVPFHAKTANKDLQQDVMRKHKSIR